MNQNQSAPSERKPRHPSLLRKLVAVYAVDWAIYDDNCVIGEEYPVVEGWIYGMVVDESEDHIAIAHQTFPLDDSARYTSSIPRDNIRTLHVLEHARKPSPLMSTLLDAPMI